MLKILKAPKSPRNTDSKAWKAPLCKLVNVKLVDKSVRFCIALHLRNLSPASMLATLAKALC